MACEWLGRGTELAYERRDARISRGHAVANDRGIANRNTAWILLAPEPVRHTSRNRVGGAYDGALELYKEVGAAHPSEKIHNH